LEQRVKQIINRRDKKTSSLYSTTEDLFIRNRK